LDPVNKSVAVQTAIGVVVYVVISIDTKMSKSSSNLSKLSHHDSSKSGGFSSVEESK